MQGEPQGALDRVTELLKFTNSNNEVSPNLHVRALMLQAHILGTFNTHGARIYVAALAEAETRYLTNLCSIITLKIAEHQVGYVLQYWLYSGSRYFNSFFYHIVLITRTTSDM
jgi:hypothetical protein